MNTFGNLVQANYIANRRQPNRADGKRNISKHLFGVAVLITTTYWIWNVEHVLRQIHRLELRVTAKIDDMLVSLGIQICVSRIIVATAFSRWLANVVI